MAWPKEGHSIREADDPSDETADCTVIGDYLSVRCTKEKIPSNACPRGGHDTDEADDPSDEAVRGSEGDVGVSMGVSIVSVVVVTLDLYEIAVLELGMSHMSDVNSVVFLLDSDVV